MEMFDKMNSGSGTYPEGDFAKITGKNPLGIQEWMHDGELDYWIESRNLVSKST